MRDFIINMSPIVKLIVLLVGVMIVLAIISSSVQESENRDLLALCLQERPREEYQCRAEDAARRIQQQRNTAIIINGSGNTQ